MVAAIAGQAIMMPNKVHTAAAFLSIIFIGLVLDSVLCYAFGSEFARRTLRPPGLFQHALCTASVLRRSGRTPHELELIYAAGCVARILASSSEAGYPRKRGGVYLNKPQRQARMMLPSPLIRIPSLPSGEPDS